ncbi:hypothetical protein [Crenalkalicoccus roseus]|uniref:hypothetical protein n=1 Tax=Crenalkalicoccus roseus TaxID=1485588 RepID=UPI001081E9F6|nr:hypothetical protein [Crenalkalicoccus roseus]
MSEATLNASHPHRAGAAARADGAPGGLLAPLPLVVGGPLAVVFAATFLLGLEPDLTLRDPAVAAGAPWHLGLFSQLGVLAWWTAAVAALTAAAALRGHPGGAWRMAAAGGGLSALLGLDDALMLHEVVLPTLFGIPEEAIFAAYGLLALGYLWAFRRLHLGFRADLMAAALCLFGASILLDIAEPGLGRWQILLEDGLKFAGICAWAAYHGDAACRLLRAALFQRRRG